MSITNLRFLILTIASLTVPGRVAVSQNLPVELPKPTSLNLASPVQQAQALAEITSYDEITGASLWSGLNGTGSITLSRASGDISGSITCHFSGHSLFRVDTDVAGIRSSMRAGDQGGFATVDGFPEHILTAQEITAGYVSFPRLKLVDLISGIVSLVDQGLITDAAGPLHRVTLEEPLRSKEIRSWSAEKINTIERVSTDLYFDPTTHLLAKSSIAQGPPYNLTAIIVSTTYSDYRKVDQSLIPFHLSQSVNGQLVWTIDFNNVQLSTDLDPTIFRR